MESQNAFEKKQVINAAKRVLQGIETDREIIKQRLCSGHKTWFGFGRKLSVNEVWDSQEGVRLAIGFHNGRQEMIVERILAVAAASVGDTMNLSTEEFAMIHDHWNE